MNDKISKVGIKLRRVLYRLGKYSMFVITVITCYNLTTHILELRAEKRKKELHKKNALIILSVLAWTSAIVVAFAGLIKYIKHLKKGYLLDLFDGDSYDVIEPDEECPAESIIKSELCGNEDAADHEKLAANHIPLDEEASEDDYA